MKVEVNGKTYCVETLIYDNERLRKEVVASAELHKSILDNLRAEIADMPKLYPFVDHIDTYVKEDDVLAIIDKYRGSDTDEMS